MKNKREVQEETERELKRGGLEPGREEGVERTHTRTQLPNEINVHAH